jgi:phosphoribosylglycinamide formyltransferase 1
VPVKNIAVLASGGGTNFQAILDAVAAGRINGRVVCLIYNRKAAYAAERAHLAGIPAIYINRKVSVSDAAFEEKIHSTLLDYNADIVVLAGWLEIIGAKTVSQYKDKIINTHPALIPAFCGKGMYGHHVHEAVIDYGAKVSGCTVHFAEEGVDTGAIIFQQAVEVLT